MVLRVLHLVGSPVSVFFLDLSLVYARDCLEATADPARYEPLIAHVAPGGLWCFPDDLRPEAIAAAPTMPLSEAVAVISALGVDLALPQMFCRPGMTTYRALLDLLGLPFVGNTAAVMAMGADKGIARGVVAAAGVRVPRGEVLRAGERPTLTPPVVVKPATADNSVGVSLVRDESELDAALETAFEADDQVLVEDYVALGREVRCGLLEVDGELIGLPLEEYDVDTDRKPIRDHADKLARDEDGALGLQAKDGVRAWIVDPDDPLTQVVHAAARLAHRALGCRHYSLFDFRVDAEGQPWFLEASLYNSFARTSVVAVMARAAGTDVPELFAASVAAALSEDGRGPRG